MSEYLKDVKDQEAIGVMEQIKMLRTENRTNRNGYSKDRTMRHLLKFKPSVLFHPEFSKYFDRNMDRFEAKKGMYEFARKHPEYLVVDKL